MNDQELEQRILAARLLRKKTKLSQFTLSVIGEIEGHATFAQKSRTTSASKWSQFMQLVNHHKIAAGLIGLSLLSVVTFSGYAYATGTNPVALVTRLIQGNKVKVEYQGRKFEYGVKRSYSDAAVTAYAELNTVGDLHFKASNAFTIPRNGIEHVDNPYNSEYIYPWVGTVDRVDASYVYVKRQYTLGDKAKQSIASDQMIKIPKKDLSYYIKGEAANPSSAITGKVVEVFQDNFLSHLIGSKNPPSPVSHYFAFELNHALPEIMEADQSNQTPPQSRSNADQDQPIFEPTWGDMSNICLGNGADVCDQVKLTGEGGQGLFIYEVAPGNMQITNNPNVISFGEMLADPSTQAPGLIIRNVEGKIVSLTPAQITIKTSSGAQWRLALVDGQLRQFADTWHSPLSLGDRIGASIVESVNNLDNRTIDNSHIYQMKRY